MNYSDYGTIWESVAATTYSLPTETTTTPSLKESPKKNSFRKFLENNHLLAEDEQEAWVSSPTSTNSTPRPLSEDLQPSPSEPRGQSREGIPRVLRVHTDMNGTRIVTIQMNQRVEQHAIQGRYLEIPVRRSNGTFSTHRIDLTEYIALSEMGPSTEDTSGRPLTMREAANSPSYSWWRTTGGQPAQLSRQDMNDMFQVIWEESNWRQGPAILEEHVRRMEQQMEQAIYQPLFGTNTTQTGPTVEPENTSSSNHQSFLQRLNAGIGEII